MCGRYVRISPVEYVADEFDVRRKASLEVGPEYNIAPSQPVLILVNRDGEKQLRLCRWGFVPPGSKAPPVGKTLINARAETVAAKPSFADAFRDSRCLIIADGFYEWQRTGKTRVPVYVYLNSGRPFGFAGLYSVRPSPERENTCTCVIITTEANELLAPVHDRMPVILPKEKTDLWLAPGAGNRQELLNLLRPYPADVMSYHVVSTCVNLPGYNGPDAIKPVAIRRNQ